jgi:hypothetical protein
MSAILEPIESFYSPYKASSRCVLVPSGLLIVPWRMELHGSGWGTHRVGWGAPRIRVGGLHGSGSEVPGSGGGLHGSGLEVTGSGGGLHGSGSEVTGLGRAPRIQIGGHPVGWGAPRIRIGGRVAELHGAGNLGMAGEAGPGIGSSPDLP